MRPFLKNRIRSPALCCFASIFFIAFWVFICTVSASGQIPGFRLVQSNSQTSSIPSDIPNNTVDVGMSVINIFDFEYTKGDYTVDMYIYFFWSNPNVATINWQFSNGYPITPTSVTLVGSNYNASTKYEIYRATARLNSAPDATDFPFDDINITISIVLINKNISTLNWLTNQTAIDSGFNNPGWKTVSYELTSSTHTYSLGVQVPNAEMVIIQQRERAATSISPFIPPLIFSLVSAVSFLFGLKEAGSVALRIGLNTSMLVTTLLFSFGASSNIPPASSMVLYTIFLLCVLIFMVCNLVVTIIGVVGWVKYRNEKRTKMANQLGFIISIIVPVVIFLFLLLVRP